MTRPECLPYPSPQLLCHTPFCKNKQRVNILCILHSENLANNHDERIHLHVTEIFIEQNIQHFYPRFYLNHLTIKNLYWIVFGCNLHVTCILTYRYMLKAPCIQK